MYVDRGGGGGGYQATTTTSGIVERLQSFMRFVQTVFFRAIDQLCRNGCGRRRCRYCRSSPYMGTGNEWPEPEINDVVPLLLPSSTTTTTTSPEGVASHRKLCWDFEEEEAQCLNGGSCFAIELHNGMRRSGCSCAPNWTGERCEMRYIDPVFWEDSDEEHYYRAASVSAEVFLLIVVVFVFLSAAYIYLRHQRSRPSNLNQSTSCPSCLSICSHLHTAGAAAVARGRNSPFCREHTNLLIPTKKMADTTLLPLKSDLVPKSCPAFRGSEGGRKELFPPKESLSSAEYQSDGSSLVNNSSNHRNLSNKGLSRKTSEFPTSMPDMI